MDPTLSNPIRGKVILTGASGFIGGRTRDALLAGGADVLALVRADSPPAQRGRSAPVDYADEAGLRALFEREQPDYIFHIAGATKGVTYDDFHRGNVLPTQSLVNALRDAHPAVKRFLMVSSLTAYGPSNDGPPIRESDAPRPVEHYGKSKLAAERLVQASELPFTIVRPAGVYGPADADTLVLFRAAKMGVNLFYGNRAKRAAMVYVDDLVDALVTAAQRAETLGKGYFLSDGVTYTWSEIQRHIGAAVGRRAINLNLPSFLVPLAGSAGELMTAVDKKPRLLNRQKALMDAQQAWLCSIDAARADFGFTPRVAMEDGTRRAYAWYKQHGWL